MDAIREIVSGNALSSIIKLPKSLRNRQVEIIVLPASVAAVSTSVPKISRNKILEMKKNSTSVKLTGAIPHAPITIAEIREERLTDRYGSID